MPDISGSALPPYLKVEGVPDRMKSPPIFVFPIPYSGGVREKPYWWMDGLSLTPISYPTMLTAAAVSKNASAALTKKMMGSAGRNFICQQHPGPAQG
jgi:hypothetical protein